MPNYFKTRFLPNPDGTDSATALTNANTAFVHTYIGDDLTGDGTREFPFRSIFKANQKSGVSYIVFRGVINEAFSLPAKRLIGDDVNQNLITSNYSVGQLVGYTNFTCDRNPETGYDYGNYARMIITGLMNTSGNSNGNHDKYFHLFLGGFNANEAAFLVSYINCTTCGFKGTFLHKNGIILIYLDAVNGTKLKNMVIPSSTILKYNGTTLTQPTWTNDSKANIQLARNAYLSAGMSQANVDLLFAKDSFGNETCRIVKESRNGGTSANIFNRYDGSGNVLDYSLNPNSLNEALYASDTGSYVGFFKAASAISSVGNTLTAPVNVLTDGSEGVAGTLLLNTADVLSFATGQSQIWNRVKSTSTIVIPNGIKFNGIQSLSTDGSPFGYYFGKFQNLMDATGLTPADALEANTIYKVHNLTRTIYESAIYNGNQYLPDYFFKTGTTPLAFTLLNSDSGTVVKKVLTTPLESIEIIPYDDETTPSTTFPKFSCPMFGDCMMLFHKIGANIDLPVLFSEVTNDKIAYYDDWAVTNADQEFVTLAADTTNYYYALPVLKYLRVEINGHFNADYDQ